jgi:diguanylate cyclase (GGDEF)-like protein
VLFPPLLQLGHWRAAKTMKLSFQNVDRVLLQRSYNEIGFIALLVLACISIVDILVGYEISTSFFFLIPIALATWYGTPRQGFIFSILSAIIWHLVDNFISVHPYSHPLIPYWNTGMRLGLFLIATRFLAQLRFQSNIEKNLSRTDGLTGLLNGRGFAEAAEKMFELAARHGRPTTLAYIDLDDFKKVNDQRGHSEGDKVLQTVGEILLNSVRKTEVAGRLGGDEFVIALPETNETGAQAAFNKLRMNLAQAMHDREWPVGFSIGVISFDLPPANFDEAVKLADALMYRVKKSGKNNILFEHYPPDKIIPASSGI